MENRRGGVLLASLAFGGLWGVAEATLGFALHWLSRLTALPQLAGLFMFPIGLLCMVQAFRTSGRAHAALLTAAVAASLKGASLALPGVTLLFVSNPVLAILAEGLVGFLLVRSFAGQALRPGRLQLPTLFAAGLAWRGLFLLAVLLLPVQKGILMKGPAALASFLLLDSLVNSLLIAGVVSLRGEGSPAERWRGALDRWRAVLLRPVGAVAALAAALGAQALVLL